MVTLTFLPLNAITFHDPSKTPHQNSEEFVSVSARGRSDDGDRL
jgi:hypothetical protein